ncbi:uncharacterized protein METZ01_LOCUS348002 [marine metagenome]|uniref:HNH nuclease domain-containing protein n=1 Tax=marine metagenome TaxID=408172 RepID=A0A382RDU3_9ZZZZ
MKKIFTKQDFLDKLIPNGDCLDWPGATNGKGYGTTRYNGRIFYTHRLALILEGIDITDKFVIHSCDRPICSNAKHLSAGTQWDNMADMTSRRRQTSTITEEECKEIRELCNTSLRQWEIAEMYGISQPQVSRINTRVHWKHLN